MAPSSKLPDKSLNGTYDYDVVVIGGGSGGLAAAKEAAIIQPGARVVCFDYVKPSPQGTTWGLGGTCVNVGCIPKKLMHYCSLLGHKFGDARQMGWNIPAQVTHKWETLVKNVDDYIRSLNFNYKKALMEARVEYINAYAEFADPHTITYTLKGERKSLTGQHFIIATGGRPKYPDDVEGATLGISSDDIFWMKKAPGKTLVVGASYIALECAGFLHELGFDTTVMVRSILLRGFDQQCAHQIGEYMERNGVRFLLPKVPTRLVKNDHGRIVAYWKDVNTGAEESEEFDTVLWAVGRDAIIHDIGLDKIGVKIDSGKIPVDDEERTNVPHIYAIGDCIKGRPELTPVAIQAGQLLARRLMGKSNAKMDYTHVPTTVFTPMEYGACGYSQEAAEQLLGQENVEVYATRYGVLEGATVWQDVLPQVRSRNFHGLALWARQYAHAHNKPFEDDEIGSYEEEEQTRAYLKQPCLAKLVCDKTKNNRVIGFHYVGPNAGEVTQGFALAIKCGATKEHFDNLVGIHPTAAEEFTTLRTTLASGEDVMKKGGC